MSRRTKTMLQYFIFALLLDTHTEMHYSKEVNIDNVKEKLSEEVNRETLKDIEDFLLPKFDTQLPDGKRTWRIVQDGHGRWREINVDKIPRKCDISRKILPKRASATSETSKTLLFSNNILNTMKSPSKLPCRRSSRQDSNYKTLSTNTRANIFPGVGKHHWYSQTNNVFTQSALMLGGQSGHDLQDGFYGITRDALGAWNEASVHHERMKKAWDGYLELLAKSGGVTRLTKELDGNIMFKENGNKTEKVKKVTKINRKQTKKETDRDNKFKSELVEPEIPTKQTERDDDFWDFYEQPFVQI